MEDKKYRLLTAVSLGMLGIGVVFYHFVEKLTWIDALYFSVVTLATVGYGDISPKTDIGKIFTIFYILIGVGIIAAFFNMRLKRVAERREKRLLKRRQRKKT